MKETNPNLQIHRPSGHIGTNIAASARFDEEEFAKAQEGSKTPSIFTRNAPKSQKKLEKCLEREGCI